MFTKWLAFARTMDWWTDLQAFKRILYFKFDVYSFLAYKFEFSVFQSLYRIKFINRIFLFWHILCPRTRQKLLSSDQERVMVSNGCKLTLKLKIWGKLTFCGATDIFAYIFWSNPFFSICVLEIMHIDKANDMVYTYIGFEKK